MYPIIGKNTSNKKKKAKPGTIREPKLNLWPYLTAIKNPNDFVLDLDAQRVSVRKRCNTYLIH